MQYDQQQEQTLTAPSLSFSRPIVWAAILIMVLTFGAGFGAGLGFANARATGQLASTGFWGILSGSGLWGSTASCPKNSPLCPDFALFWEAMELLYRDFNGELPAAETATYNAIRGIVGELGDPNTSFLTPQEAEFFRTNIEGVFEGIGARVDWDEEADTLRIAEPFENQPAWKAGLKRGDLILEVDGVSLVGTDLTSSVHKIRGPKGTKIVLTIRRLELPDPFKVEVERDRIETPTIDTDMLGDGRTIAYVKLNTFNQNAGQLVHAAFENALQHKPAALILDLRGNPGGLLREAVKVASVFMEGQVVLYERFSNGETETYETSGKPVSVDLPMLVLVNEGSASASEIVAGALQDNGRARLLGTKTYGKGSVQLPHTLSNGAIMRVTVARWYTPNDNTIDGVGLIPDILVEISDEERKSEIDPQLAAAIDLLEQEIGVR